MLKKNVINIHYIKLLIRKNVVALLRAKNKDTKEELSQTNILIKDNDTTYTNERVTSETVSVRLSGLSVGILPSA